MNEFTAIPIKDYERARGKPRATFKLINTVDLMEMEFEPVRWMIEGYVPEGFSVLAGRQKLGKTWLAIDFALAVATGGAAMGGIPCDQGDVLYIDMENGSRRIQSRIETLYPDERSRPNLSHLDWVTDAPPLDKGFIDALEDWRRTTKNPRMIVIDVLQRIKPIGNAARNSYENDYSAWAPLQKWATENRIAVLGLHHTKKGGADDPLEALSGSNGLSACADTTLVLDRDSNGVTLYVRGRDVEEKESALDFAAGIWTVKGHASEVRRSDERNKVAVTLEQATEPMSPSELADVTGMKSGNIGKLLFMMAKAGEALKTGRGLYIHPANSHLAAKSKTPGNNGNIGNNRSPEGSGDGQSYLVTDVTAPPIISEKDQ